jgi:hypothetical protein
MTFRTVTMSHSELDRFGPENDKIAGQHVTVFDYPDGRFKNPLRRARGGLLRL